MKDFFSFSILNAHSNRTTQFHYLTINRQMHKDCHSAVAVLAVSSASIPILFIIFKYIYHHLLRPFACCLCSIILSISLQNISALCSNMNENGKQHIMLSKQCDNHNVFEGRSFTYTITISISTIFESMTTQLHSNEGLKSK